MANRQKAIGTRAETEVRRYFESHGFTIVRKAPAGSDDEGDLRLMLRDGTEVAIEVKAGKQTQNPSKYNMDEWKWQTIVEGINSHTLSVLIIRRYRKKIDNIEVWIPNKTWFGHEGWTMMYLSEFVKGETCQGRNSATSSCQDSRHTLACSEQEDSDTL